MQKLLEFLPEDDQFVTPAVIEPKVEEQDEDQAESHQLLPEEIRQVIWPYIRHAARMWNGIRVGEVT